MSIKFEHQLLNLTPQSLSFTPETVPIGQIIAHGNIDSNDALEKSMRQLAKQLPFKYSDWPSFTANVEERIRVQVRLGSIEILFVERGLGSPLDKGLTFAEAFFKVLRYISPKYSIEAKRHADLATNAKVRSWLALASRVKHMYEVNETYGRLAAMTCLELMCRDLVTMQAFRTLAAAATAAETLVHTLRLGGLPEQMARAVYQEFMPAQMKKPVITMESIIVSEAAFKSTDPAAIVQSNVDFIAAQLDADMTAEEISPEALKSYYVHYFLTHLNSGGFARFVYHCGWNSTIVRTIHNGLKEMDASWHTQLFSRATKALKQIGQKRLDCFLASSDLDDSDPIVNKITALLSRYDDSFRAEEEIKSLLTYNADWLRQHPRLIVLSDDAIAQAFQERLRAKSSRPTRLSRYGLNLTSNWRMRRLCHELCDIADIKDKYVFSGVRHRARYYKYNGNIGCGWFFRADSRGFFMLDLMERAVLFDFDKDSVTAICEIDASDARFNPEVPVERDLIPHFIDLIEKNDFMAIESAFTSVQLYHVDALVAYYNTRNDSDEGWNQKQLVLDLVRGQIAISVVQDQSAIGTEINEALRPIMLDFLSVPAGLYDYVDKTLSLALHVVINQYEEFDLFNNNRPLLMETIATVLRENGLESSQ